MTIYLVMDTTEDGVEITAVCFTKEVADSYLDKPSWNRDITEIELNPTKEALEFGFEGPPIVGKAIRH